MEIARRTLGQILGFGVAGAAVAPVLPALRAPAGTLRVSDGTAHPVSKAQATRLNVAFGTTWPSEDRAISIRDSLLRLSEKRHARGGVPLTAEEHASLRACDDVVNMNRAYRLMRGRDYREIFGPAATLDQIHHNSIHKPCGCVVNFIFDHNKRHEAEFEHHPHHSTVACVDHAHLTDFREHFAVVIRG